jgi:ribosome-associated toxin RatA of RatAB toxin-antitoxin module
LPVGLLVLVLVVLAVVWVRGTWADTTARDPKSPAEGPICQLYQRPDGHKEVRCAMVLPYPADKVWKVVTDYGDYAEILPYLADIRVEHLDESLQMTGKAKSALWGWWDFALDIREQKSHEPWSATWDNSGSGVVRVNRGGWTLRPLEKDQTLLVLALETEIHHTPTFFLRNVFMHRLPLVLHAVEARLQKQAAE